MENNEMDNQVNAVTEAAAVARPEPKKVKAPKVRKAKVEAAPALAFGQPAKDGMLYAKGINGEYAVGTPIWGKDKAIRLMVKAPGRKLYKTVESAFESLDAAKAAAEKVDAERPQPELH